MSISNRSPIDTDNLIKFPEFKFKIENIPMEVLDFPDELFDQECINPEEGSALVLPILVFASGKRFKVIDGCKRLKSVKETMPAGTLITCCILDPSPDPLSAGIMRIRINKGRSLQLVEKIRFLSWMKANLPEKTYISETSCLGIPDRERFDIEQLFTAGRRVIDAVAGKKIDVTIAPDLNHFKEQVRDQLIRLLTATGFSRQMQRELIDWLPEIAYRDRISLESLISNEITPILNGTVLNPPQKIEKIREHVFELRFPLYNKALEQWRKDVRAANPDPGRIRFEPCQGFEKDRLEINITVTDPVQATSIFERLSKVPPALWERLIRPFSKIGSPATGQDLL